MPETTRRRSMRRAPAPNRMQWLYTRDLSAYRGKWIVARGRRIVGAGRTLKAALRRAKLPRGAVPFVHWVPHEETWIL